MNQDQQNQIGSITYIVGLFIGFALAVLFAPLSALAALVWDPPNDLEIDRELAELLGRGCAR